jgi:hypothetical protein
MGRSLNLQPDFQSGDIMKIALTASLITLATAFALTACGTQEQHSESRIMDGEPDFKAADGSNIIDWAKKSANAKSVCQVITQFKSQGFRSDSQQTTAAIAQQFKLHTTEAEVVAAYVVEFTCPENR